MNVCLIAPLSPQFIVSVSLLLEHLITEQKRHLSVKTGQNLTSKFNRF